MNADGLAIGAGPSAGYDEGDLIDHNKNGS